MLRNLVRSFSTKKLTHVNNKGEASMVSVGHKTPTLRTAVASCSVYLPDGLDTLIKENALKKGDIIAAARLSGILAAKKTSELVMLCHPVSISSVTLDFDLKPKKMIITSRVEAYDKTGLEMEAITAVGVAAINVYDFGKAVSKKIVINNIRLLSKTGGKSGDFKA